MPLIPDVIAIFVPIITFSPITVWVVFGPVPALPVFPSNIVIIVRRPTRCLGRFVWRSIPCSAQQSPLASVFGRQHAACGALVRRCTFYFRLLSFTSEQSSLSSRFGLQFAACDVTETLRYNWSCLIPFIVLCFVPFIFPIVCIFPT
jgi:hypothetical protein